MRSLGPAIRCAIHGYFVPCPRDNKKQNSNTIVIVPALLGIEPNIASIAKSANIRIRQDEQPLNLCNRG